MKKIVLIGCMAASLFSCKDDPEEPVAPSYPTDGLELPQQKNALLITGYSPGEPSMLTYEVYRQQQEHEYGAQLNHMSLTVTTGNALYSPVADSIRNYLLNLSPPFFVLDYQELSGPELNEAVETSINEQPLLSVAHKVSENDTAWIIDNKVKFFKDTGTTGIFVQTYMLGDIRAKNYPGANLNVPAQENFTRIADSASFWARDLPSMDSSETIIENGDPYYHPWVLRQAFEQTHSWGVHLGSYWRFGGEFYNGDVIGTRDTPIRHYFLKHDLANAEEEILLDYEPKFLTVVWILNPVTSGYEYVNSYMVD